eukprot:4121093-Pyramimonas_sp.AAC.1
MQVDAIVKRAGAKTARAKARTAKERKATLRGRRATPRGTTERPAVAIAAARLATSQPTAARRRRARRWAGRSHR